MKIVKLLLLMMASGCGAIISIKYNFEIGDKIAIYAISIVSYIAGTMINFLE